MLELEKMGEIEAAFADAEPEENEEEGKQNEEEDSDEDQEDEGGEPDALHEEEGEEVETPSTEVDVTDTNHANEAAIASSDIDDTDDAKDPFEAETVSGPIDDVDGVANDTKAGRIGSIDEHMEEAGVEVGDFAEDGMYVADALPSPAGEPVNEELAPEPESDPDQWVCSQCTYLNKMTRKTCEMCKFKGNAKRRKK